MCVCVCVCMRACVCMCVYVCLRACEFYCCKQFKMEQLQVACSADAIKQIKNIDAPTHPESVSRAKNKRNIDYVPFRIQANNTNAPGTTCS